MTSEFNSDEMSRILATPCDQFMASLVNRLVTEISVMRANVASIEFDLEKSGKMNNEISQDLNFLFERIERLLSTLNIAKQYADGQRNKKADDTSSDS